MASLNKSKSSQLNIFTWVRRFQVSQSEKPLLPTRQLENKTLRRRKIGVSDASSYTSTSPYVFAFNSPLRPAPVPKPAPPMATKKKKENKVRVK